MKLIPPDVDSVNNTIPGASHFTEEVFPKDSLQQQDPNSVGFTFTKSEDPSVNRYGGYNKRRGRIMPDLVILPQYFDN